MKSLEDALTCGELPTDGKLVIGSVVQARPRHALRSGCEVWDYAYCVSVEPLIFISECGIMRWNNLCEADLRVVGYVTESDRPALLNLNWRMKRDGLKPWCGQDLMGVTTTNSQILKFNTNEDYSFEGNKFVPILGTDFETIKRLPQFFRADFDYAYRLGGPYIREILEGLPFSEKAKYISIDSRVHMLMPGMYPCIPGWHCDDFYRPDGQPALTRLKSEAWSRHWAMVWGDDAFTEFLGEDLEVMEHEVDWNHVYKFFDNHIESKKMKTVRCEHGQFVEFSPLAFHRGTVATKSSWRFFIRITESDHWEPKNELRTQTQVYLTSTGQGW